MKFLRLVFPPYFRRLRWEIAGWWIYSAIVSYRCLHSFQAEELAQLARPEIVLALWITLRLALIDEIFGTLAGRHCRPIRGREIAAARALLAVIAFLPPLLLRIHVWQQLAEPDAAAWHDYLLKWVAPLILNLALFGASLQIAAFLSRRLFHRARRVVSGVFLVLAGWFILSASARLQFADHRLVPQVYRDSPWSHAIRESISAQLPPGSKLIGDWVSFGVTQTEVVELLRIPIREGRIRAGAGTIAEVTEVDATGGRLSAKVQIISRDVRLAEGLPDSTPIVEFPGGYYSMSGSRGGSIRAYPVALLPLGTFRANFEVRGPAIFPWHDESQAAKHAELVIYAPDRAQPPQADKSDPCLRIFKEDEQPVLPELHRQVMTRTDWEGTRVFYVVIPDDLDAKIEDQVRGAMLMSTDRDKTDPRITRFILSKERAAMLPVLAWPTWSDPQWKEIVQPLLLEQATVEDRPQLLERLKNDTRLAAVFAAKHWEADALPVLKDRLREGLPLGRSSLQLVLGSRDPALGKEMTRAALQMDGSVEDLEDQLENYPGFDWQHFALEGWRQRKYRPLRADALRGPAVRAAREGDASALRYLAEQAVLDEDGYAEKLRTLVTTDSEDTVGFVKANFDKLSFDPTTRSWK